MSKSIPKTHFNKINLNIFIICWMVARNLFRTIIERSADNIALSALRLIGVRNEFRATHFNENVN